MAKCGDCVHFRACSNYVTADETFPEVGGCSAFKNKGDFVEVVRCKDCKHCEMCYPVKQIDKEAMQAWICHRYKMYRNPDDYCSYGERSEGE